MNVLVVAVLALLLSAPLYVDAQEATQLAVQDAPRLATASPDRADRLAAEARRLFPEPRSWPRAARLLERSARLRDVAHPDRSTAFLDAARIYVHTGALADARRAFEAAAEAASARGAVAEAAHALLDASIVAARTGDRTGAAELRERGALLARSPHLADSDRRRILSRLPVTTARHR